MSTQSLATISPAGNNPLKDPFLRETLEKLLKNNYEQMYDCFNRLF